MAWSFLRPLQAYNSHLCICQGKGGLASNSALVLDLALFQVWQARFSSQRVSPGVRAHPHPLLPRRMAQAMHPSPQFPSLPLHLKGDPGQGRRKEQRGRRERPVDCWGGDDSRAGRWPQMVGQMGSNRHMG